MAETLICQLSVALIKRTTRATQFFLNSSAVLQVTQVFLLKVCVRACALESV